jgi:hypothetical protein
MRMLFFLVAISTSVLAKSQHSYLVGNAQLSPFLNDETILSNYEFQVNSRIGMAIYSPLYYDSLKQREWLGLEVGLGTFFNSFYYTKSGNPNARITTSFNSVKGLFLNAEPYFNFIQDKNNRFSAHASVNVLMYYYDGSGSGSETEKDSTLFDQTSDKPENIIQIGIEPSIGISYLFPSQSDGGLLLRLKGALVLHNQEVARLSVSNSTETANVKINDYQLTLSVGWRFKTKR